MKTVFDNRQCIHVWAQQTQASGRNPKHSLSFEGERLYSYRICIAKFVTHKDKRGVIITTKKYSVTTSGKHTPSASDIPPGVTVMHAPDVYAGTHESSHGDNIAHFQKHYAEELTKLSRARDRADYKIAWLERIKEEARLYCEFFDIPFDRHAFPTPTPEALAEARARANKASAEKRKETKERKQKNIARALVQCAEYLGGASDSLAWGIERYITAEQYAQLQECSVQRFRERRPMAARIKLASRYPLLRINGEEIETSQGARFPVSHAVKAWPVIRHCRETGSAWKRNGHQVHLGHFQIDSIEPDGDVHAGCHHVQFEEIERIAKELGVL